MSRARWAVLADVHGNLPALEAVLADVRRHDVDGIIVAGDLVGGGPHSREVVRRLRALDGHMIRGNNDDYFIQYDAGDAPAGWQAGEQWAAMRWGRTIAVDGRPPVCVVHGSPGDASVGLLPERDEAAWRCFARSGVLSAIRGAGEQGTLARAFSMVDAPVLVCGHTHIPWQERRGERLAFNPGAVSGSLNGDPRAHYALLVWRGDRWQVVPRTVAYDVALVRAAFQQSGLLETGGAFARACLLTIETGWNVAGYFVSHTFALAAEAGFEACAVVPDEVWERAVATFPWERWEVR